MEINKVSVNVIYVCKECGYQNNCTLEDFGIISLMKRVANQSIGETFSHNEFNNLNCKKDLEIEIDSIIQIINFVVDPVPYNEFRLPGKDKVNE